MHDEFRFGQVGLCERGTTDSSDERVELRICIGTAISMDGHIKMFIPSREPLCSRRTFRLAPRSPSLSEQTSTLRGWNCLPTRHVKRWWEPTVEVPESIVVSIGDPSLPGSMVTQAVKLVNQA